MMHVLQYDQHIRSLDATAFRAECIRCLTVYHDLRRRRSPGKDAAWLLVAACHEELRRRLPELAEGVWRELEEEVKENP